MGKKSFQLIIICVSIFSLFSGAVNLFASETKTFEFTASKYTYELEKIEVNVGDKVVLSVTAADTDHGLGIKEYNINQVLPKGKTVVIEFIADKMGTFAIKCTEFCGWGHFGMNGELVVS